LRCPADLQHMRGTMHRTVHWWTSQSADYRSAFGEGRSPLMAPPFFSDDHPAARTLQRDCSQLCSRREPFGVQLCEHSTSCDLPRWTQKKYAVLSWEVPLVSNLRDVHLPFSSCLPLQKWRTQRYLAECWREHGSAGHSGVPDTAHVLLRPICRIYPQRCFNFRPNVYVPRCG